METVLHTKDNSLQPGLILLFLLFLFISSCASPENRLALEDCEKFKNGLFHPKGEKNYIVERKGSEQIETDLETGNKFFFEVTWLNACNYSLELVHSISSDSIALSTKDLMQIEMIELTDSSYRYRLTYEKKFLEAELMKIDRKF